MRIAVLGGGPGGLYFAALAKQLDARHDDHRLGAQRRRRHVRLRRGVLRRDPGRHRARRHRDLPGHAPRVRPLGRHRRALPGHDVHLRRARLRRDEPQAAAGHPAGPVRGAGRAGPLPHRGAGRGGPGRGLRPGGRRRRSELADPGEVRRYVPAQIWKGGGASTSGWAPTWCSTRSSSTSWTPRPGSCRCTATRTATGPAPSSWRCTRTSGGGPGSPRPRAWCPVRATRPRSQRIRDLCAEVLGGPSGGKHSLVANNSRWTTFTTVRCQTWRHENVVLLGDAAHTAHFSIGSGTKLAMEDALALAACLHEQDGIGGGPGRLRGRAPAGGGLDPARGAGQPGVVREPRPVRRPGPAPVRLQHHDPQPPGHLRQPAAARPGVRGRDGRVVRGQPGGRPRGVCPPMFQPFRIGRLELANRVIVSPMDMYSATRRRAGRLPPGAPGQQGAGRRGAGDDRDGLRLPRRADHARLHRHLHRRAGGVLAAGGGVRARADAARRSGSSSGTPGGRARPG